MMRVIIINVTLSLHEYIQIIALKLQSVHKKNGSSYIDKPDVINTSLALKKPTML